MWLKRVLVILGVSWCILVAATKFVLAKIIMELFNIYK